MPEKALTDFSILTFISDLKNTGLIFSEKLIYRFCASLLTKQFVLLTGLSGSGKTKLAETFSMWICRKERNKSLLVKDTIIQGKQAKYFVKEITKNTLIIKDSNNTDIAFPMSLIDMWIKAIKDNGFTEETPSQTIQEKIKGGDSVNKTMNSFHSPLKAIAFFFITTEKRKIDTPRQICFVPVGADWTNREPLLGFPNALQKGEYVKPDTGVLDLLISASENPEDPYFLILDEMNLSHVERYFADFLSAMESSDGSIYLHPDTEEWGASSIPARIQLPRNLFIVGTVNIDETTYMFSPKVLDRANVIEFRVSKDEMSSYFESAKKVDITSISGAGSSCAQGFLQKALEHIEGDNAAVQQAIMPFFDIMQDAGAEFGFRTASEMTSFIHKCTDISKGAMTKNEIIDAAVMQKILPKLHGSRNKIDKIIEKLAELCFEQKPEGNIFDAPKERAKYPVTFEKLGRMRKRLHSDGFTSYAEA